MTPCQHKSPEPIEEGIRVAVTCPRGHVVTIHWCDLYKTNCTHRRWADGQQERICIDCPDWPPVKDQ